MSSEVRSSASTADASHVVIDEAEVKAKAQRQNDFYLESKRKATERLSREHGNNVIDFGASLCVMASVRTPPSSPTRSVSVSPGRPISQAPKNGRLETKGEDS